MWATKGYDLVAQRNTYSEIVDYQEYNIDYNENLIGAGVQYSFTEKAHLRLLYQAFTWDDAMESTLDYNLNTWTLFFTMNF